MILTAVREMTGILILPKRKGSVREKTCQGKEAKKRSFAYLLQYGYLEQSN